MATPESEAFVRTFARGLKVIEVMGQSTGGQTIAQVSEAANLARTAVRRFLMTLTELGFVKTDGKQYWLTPKVLRLGLSYLYTLPFWRQAQLALEELGARIGQSCAISVLDGEEIVYIQRFHMQRILAMSPSLGSRLPAHAVSMGRVQLSGLEDEALRAYFSAASLKKFTSQTLADPELLFQEIVKVRKQAYSWVDGELDEAICGLAVPVRDQAGNILAAINVSLVTGSYDEAAAVAAFLPELRLAASRLRAGAS
ncbi:MAG: bacterial transcriptional regulator family protein 39 [Paucimonas sp.]|jgi:IclR family pca regulon transcriptional regulator|nr:bacterial transcriptional regulator family protein 39 [Paucimonas sp.]